MDNITLFLMPFAIWRVTSLLVDEVGPFSILQKLRYFIGVRYDEMSNRYGKNVVAEALLCIWCASIWVSIVFSIGYFLSPEVLFWIELPLSMSAVAILWERVING